MLLEDVAFSQQQIARFSGHSKLEETDVIEGSFWIKAAIRCLLGAVDGISYAMRMAVVEHAASGALTLTKQEVARLREKKYDKNRDRLLNEPSLLSTAESFKLALRYFPRIFGSDYSLDTSGEEWRAFQRVVQVRNGFTHPKSLDDLGVFNAGSAVVPAIQWIVWVYSDLFRDLGGRTGMSLPRAPLPTYTYKERDSPRLEVFSSSRVALLAEWGSSSIGYVRRIFELLHGELMKALDLVNRETPLGSRQWQFGMRLAAQTVFSNIEATIGAVEFFLKAAAMRGEVQICAEEWESCYSGEVEDRLVASLNLWSRELGTGYRVERQPEKWKHFRGFRFFRNRTVHPKGPESLAVGQEQLADLLGALRFLIEIHRATELDIERWIKKSPQFADLGKDSDSILAFGSGLESE